jgi:hypothetical protein
LAGQELLSSLIGVAKNLTIPIGQPEKAFILLGQAEKTN